jgi:hypothetical protein
VFLFLFIFGQIFRTNILTWNMHKLNPLTQNNLTLQFSQEKKSNNRSLSTIMILFTINFTAPVLYIALLSLTQHL